MSTSDHFVSATIVPTTTDVSASPPSKVVMKHIKCVQLDQHNYYSWEAQFSAMLRGFGLMDYVEACMDLSSPVAHQQDQLILSWILTGISPAILPQVAANRTSATVWAHFQKLFTFSTEMRQLHLRFQLQIVRKGNLSMEDFITKISVLAVTGERLKESEIILIMLGALGEGYDSFVTSVTTRFDPEMTFVSLCELLMDKEIRTQQNQSVLNPLFVNAAVKNSPKIGDQPSKTDLKCQICGHKSHSALNCYNRLNLTKFPPSHSCELSPFGPTGSNCATPHLANLMTMWYPDFGMTSYITAASGNVQQLRPFSNNECILMAVGSPLPISGHGRSVVCSSTNKSFILQDLLLVPIASRNLLSVNKFCCDNNVYLVFDSPKVQVWDLATKEVLMEGQARDGLYELPLRLNSDGTTLLCETSPIFYGTTGLVI